MKDPAYIADAKKLHLDVNAVPPDKLAQMISDIYETPQSVIDRVRSVIGVPGSKAKKKS
jgi:hypothetical protein